MIEISLWGNATDLSLLATLKFEDLERLQGKKAILEQQKNIVVNDMEKVFEYFDTLKDAHIDIVLDNAGTPSLQLSYSLTILTLTTRLLLQTLLFAVLEAKSGVWTLTLGFELFVDVFLATYLLEIGAAKTVVCHPKNFGWFVSDVLPSDFTSLFSLLQDPSIADTPEHASDLAFLRERWLHYYGTGRIKVRQDEFWTTAHPYWRMKTYAPELYKELQGSDLVIYKGDLNYRKLVEDVNSHLLVAHSITGLFMFLKFVTLDAPARDCLCSLLIEGVVAEDNVVCRGFRTDWPRKSN